METTNFSWDATTFFEKLVGINKFAQEKRFAFKRVSSLEGFYDALSDMKKRVPLVAVSDVSQGSLSTDNTPHTRRVKTVFLCMPHAVGDMIARQKCMDAMRELFRQFMTVLILEKTKLEEHSIYLDGNISFNEIDQYFFSGMACTYFQLAIDTYTNLVYNEDEWQTM